MPFRPGEFVDLVFTGDPGSTVFVFDGGRPRTLDNGGLELKRKSALKAVFRLPVEPGRYSYEWRDGEGRAESGLLRVQGRASRAPEPAPARAASRPEAAQAPRVRPDEFGLVE
jgi:hypothetical protein